MQNDASDALMSAFLIVVLIIFIGTFLLQIRVLVIKYGSVRLHLCVCRLWPCVLVCVPA